MRESGRISAALEVLSDFDSRRVPLKVALADWARGARYAGSKDRAFISGLCLDVLRRKSSLAALGGGDRLSVAYTLTHFWGRSVDEVAAAYAEEPHGPGALSDQEQDFLSQQLPTQGAEAANIPAFCWPLLERVVDDPVTEGLASAQRAPFDLRINTLKTDRERVLKALSAYAPSSCQLSAYGLRLPIEQAETKSPQLTVTPAYNKGWIEVQDEGSQLSALAAGPIEGLQVLDFCAGGGGKTLALSAQMEQSGQVFAYDNDAARLAPAFERLARAGVRNAQVISPAENGSKLDELRGKMDVVFVDAPCSGSGTWRRRPDTKWRLTESQLARRMEEQDDVLAMAQDFLTPGGVLIYVTCSYFAEENEDRIVKLLQKNHKLSIEDPVAPMVQTGRLEGEAEATLRQCLSERGTLRLTPGTTGTDGFGITRLRLEE